MVRVLQSGAPQPPWAEQGAAGHPESCPCPRGRWTEAAISLFMLPRTGVRGNRKTKKSSGPIGEQGATVNVQLCAGMVDLLIDSLGNVIH